MVAKGARLSFAPGNGGNFVRIWCTDAPLGSALRGRLDASGYTRIQVHEGDIAAPPAVATTWDFQPDKPGKYALTAQEYTRGASAWGGSYAGDPKGFATETKAGVEVSTTIDFGSRVTMQVGYGADTATLALWVWDATIRATSFALHGEFSPALLSPSSPIAQTAAASCRSSLLALVDVAASTAMGGVQTIVGEMFTKFTGHNTAVVHAAGGDAVNAPNIALALADSKTGIPKALSELIAAWTLHLNTDKARAIPFVAAGPGTGAWHNVGIIFADGVNAVRAQPPATMELSYIALADLWLSYEGHRVNLSVHSGPDNTPLNAPAPLLALHIAFLTVLRSNAPAPNPTENPGAVTLIHGAGMKGS